MTRVWRAIVYIVVCALFSVGCMSSAQVDSTDAAPTSTPLPTVKPVFIPTTPPSPATPVPPPTAVVTTSDADDEPSEAESNEAESQDDASDTAEDGEATETAEPTATVAPTTAPTSAPAPQPTSPPAPRPTPLPTRNACPNGQVLVGATCACPAGQAKRASDQLCVRLCVQSDLTISNSCVCTGDLVDNGGQCVKRCSGAQVTDEFGGCKLPDSNGT